MLSEYLPLNPGCVHLQSRLEVRLEGFHVMNHVPSITPTASAAPPCGLCLSELHGLRLQLACERDSKCHLEGKQATTEYSRVCSYTVRSCGRHRWIAESPGLAGETAWGNGPFWSEGGPSGDEGRAPYFVGWR